MIYVLAASGVLINFWALLESSSSFVSLRPNQRISLTSLRNYDRRSCMAFVNLMSILTSFVWLIIVLTWAMDGRGSYDLMEPIMWLGVIEGIGAGFAGRSIRILAARSHLAELEGQLPEEVHA